MDELDPLEPFMAYDPQPFRDWIDFYERVAKPIVEDEDSEAQAEAMRLYRLASPYFIMVCLHIAAKRAGIS